MKKHKWLSVRPLLALFSILFLTTGAVPVKAAEPDLLFGETHNYSVIMRGNGESIVYARIVLSNNGDSALNEYGFEVPKLAVAEMVGYQIELTPSCSIYDYDTRLPESGKRPCLTYSEPDYSSTYFDSSNAQYHKLKFASEGNAYKISLPKPVEPQKQTAVMISYTGKGYVNETMGLYKFNFETLKVAKRIKQANVAVDVDSDLVMEGKRAKVNYQTSTSSAGSGINSGAELSLNNRAALDSVVSSIGNYGLITKDAKNLAAGETLSVRGKYAASQWRLNLNKIVICVLVVAGLVAGSIILARILRRRSSKNVKPTVTNRNPAVSDRLLQPLTMLAGLVSAIVVAAGSVLFSYIVRGSAGDPDPLSTIIIGIIILLFYLLAIFGTAMWFAIHRRSWKIFIYIVFWEFAWLIALAAIYQFGLKDLFVQTDPPSVYPAVDTMELEAD